MKKGEELDLHNTAKAKKEGVWLSQYMPQLATSMDEMEANTGRAVAREWRKDGMATSPWLVGVAVPAGTIHNNSAVGDRGIFLRKYDKFLD